MLSQTLFDRECIVMYDRVHFELLRTLGYPVVLFDGDSRVPIASVNVMIEEETNNQVFVCETNPNTFMAFTREEVNKVTLAISNLSFNDHINIIVSNDEFTREFKNIPPGKSVSVYKIPTKKPNYISVMGSHFAHGSWECCDLICRVIQVTHNWKGIGAVGPITDPFQQVSVINSEEKVTLAIDTFRGEAVEFLTTPSKLDIQARGFVLVQKYYSLYHEQALHSVKTGVKDSEECCICLESCTDVILVPCGHKVYHHLCMIKVENKESCPLCRSYVRAVVHTK